MGSAPSAKYQCYLDYILIRAAERFNRWCVPTIFGQICGNYLPKLTPPHLRTVTLTTCALSKKAGVGARERMLLRKNEGGLQSL